QSGELTAPSPNASRFGNTEAVRSAGSGLPEPRPVVTRPQCSRPIVEELKFRIQLPPADSPSLSGFRLRPGKDAGFPPFLRPCGAAASAETRKARQHALRRGSVSVGRYSSTAVLPEAVCEIGGIGRK